MVGMTEEAVENTEATAGPTVEVASEPQAALPANPQQGDEELNGKRSAEEGEDHFEVASKKARVEVEEEGKSVEPSEPRQGEPAAEGNGEDKAEVDDAPKEAATSNIQVSGIRETLQTGQSTAFIESYRKVEVRSYPNTIGSGDGMVEVVWEGPINVTCRDWMGIYPALSPSYGNAVFVQDRWTFLPEGVDKGTITFKDEKAIKEGGDYEVRYHVDQTFEVATTSDVFTVGPVTVSKLFKAPQLKLSKNDLTVTGEKGYRLARATHGVDIGCWYCEVKVDSLGEKGHVRLGWSTEKGDLQAPVGFDKFSFSYRDREGTKFHESRGKPYGEPYGEGDVIGMYISLPYIDKPKAKPASAATGEPHPGSEIRFFKNGKDMGAAFTDIPQGVYFPAVSLYMGATATFSFGPEFVHPIEDLALPKKCMPMSSRASKPCTEFYPFFKE